MTSERIVERLLEMLRDRPDLSVAKRVAVDRGDRRDLGMRAAHEGLVGHVKFGPIDGPLFDLHSEVLAGKRNNGVPRNALEHTLGQIRSNDLVVAYDNNARPRPLGDLAL